MRWFTRRPPARPAQPAADHCPTLHECGLQQCPACLLVLKAPADERLGPGRCPRCEAQLRGPLRRSVGTTTALLLAAAALYVPSNTLPIMITRSAVGERADTIMSGVVALAQAGSWPLAAIVFIASVLVPLLKLSVLSYLVLAVHLGWQRGRTHRTTLYRLIETVGRWSMLDVFVVGMLASLVQLGPAAQVSAGPGVVAFGTVVWLTLWATQSFDPRLLWQAPGAPAACARLPSSDRADDRQPDAAR
ncbi:paraquat-inducible protein A [Aquincola tertiaricarbonis]|uniref:Paraquat-inducible protein A n=1 Tax=Aquincola tertiaricarbonis TaxID=391953 RepID=A0ABY4SDR0_AQUTE|nr:paraquat-inducible protein A [Aquincola tertiaricarbonis]URI09171.1 paraquat-inducible protein A [Aquincola tertiaricarbonis]